ncbi:MAG: hypothetical protein Q9159_001085 [Coniocarpon cinnabarinum]
MAPQVAWIGLGNMGRGMAKNLAEKGKLSQPLAVFNRTTKRAEDFVAAREADQAKVVTHMDDVVKSSDIIFFCLGDDKSVTDAVAAFVGNDVSGKLFVDCSTIHPNTSNEISQTLTTKGAEFVAMPIFGAPAMAEAGQVITVLAGPKAAVEKVKPYTTGVIGRLDIDFSDQEPAKASLMKIVGNTLILQMNEALAEGHVLAEKSGLGSENLHTFVTALFGAAPYGAYSNRMMQGDYYKRDEVSFPSPSHAAKYITNYKKPLFGVDLVRKDARHALNIADAHGVRMRAVEVCDGHLKDIQDHMGSKGDIPGIYGAVRKESGLKFENLPPLHIPSHSPSPLESRSSSELPLAQRRKLHSPKHDRGTQTDEPSITSVSSGYYNNASDATAWSPAKLSADYLLNKPLPPLPEEAQKDSPDPPAHAYSHVAFANATESHQKKLKGNSKSLAAAMRVVAKAISFSRKSGREVDIKRVRPSNYVDKGTQTSPEDFLPMQSPINQKQTGPDPNALRQYHASITAGHDSSQKRRMVRPSVANIKSLKSFLVNTSPSQPGTPTPMESISSKTPSSASSPSPTVGTPPYDKYNLTARSIRGAIDPVTANTDPSVRYYNTPSTNASLATIGTYDSQYSLRPRPTIEESMLPGASTVNAKLPGKAATDSSMAPPAQEDVQRSGTRRSLSDIRVSEQSNTAAASLSTVMRPPTPMPIEASAAQSAPPLAPPRFALKSPLNFPAKGRQAELRRSSPSRQSPLRQLTGVDEQIPSTKDTPASATSRQSASRDITSDAARHSPGLHDHHARAAQRGLPPDAFIPPPTPPLEEFVFRRPVFDYFSTPDAQVAKHKQEQTQHVPDHYQNSPLCPLHPKHRG